MDLDSKQIDKKTADFFRTVPVEKAWLFGSFSRGVETAESDIDILVRYDNDAKISLLYISHLMGVLEKILHRKVDLVEEGCLLPFAEETD